VGVAINNFEFGLPPFFPRPRPLAQAGFFMVLSKPSLQKRPCRSQGVACKVWPARCGPQGAFWLKGGFFDLGVLF